MVLRGSVTIVTVTICTYVIYFMRLVPLPRLCICGHISDHSSCFFPYSFSSYLVVIYFRTCIILDLRKETKLLKISALWSLHKVPQGRIESTRGLVSRQSLVKALDFSRAPELP